MFYGDNVVGWVGLMIFLIPLLVAWSMVWKGWALWISARKGSKPWFVVLLILNTMGILEILYIFWLSKESKHEDLTASQNLPKNS